MENSPVTPMLLRMREDVNPTQTVRSLSKEQGVKLVEVLLDSRTRIEVLQATVTEAVDMGWWVLIHEINLFPRLLHGLTSIATSIPAGRVHEQFRLWLTAESTSRLPPKLVHAARLLAVEPPHRLKEHLAFVEEMNFQSIILASDHHHSKSDASASAAEDFDPRVPVVHASILAKQDLKISSARGDLTDSELFLAMRHVDRLSSATGQPLEPEVLTGVVVDAIHGPAFYEPCGVEELKRLIGAGWLLDNKDRNAREAPADNFGGNGSLKIPSRPKEIPDFARAVSTLDELRLLGVDWVACKEPIARAAMNTLQCASILWSADTRLTPAPVDGDLEELVERMLEELQPAPLGIDGMAASSTIRRASNAREHTAPWLLAERHRYQVLHKKVENDLLRILRLLKAGEVLSQRNAALSEALRNDLVPTHWLCLSPAFCPKKLQSWMAAMNERFAYIRRLDMSDDSKGAPVVWLPGLFAPQVYLDTLRHAHAERLNVPAEQRVNIHLFISTTSTSADLNAYGHAVSGLQVEGAIWDPHGSLLLPARRLNWCDKLPSVLLVPHWTGGSDDVQAETESPRFQLADGCTFFEYRLLWMPQMQSIDSQRRENCMYTLRAAAREFDAQVSFALCRN